VVNGFNGGGGDRRDREWLAANLAAVAFRGTGILDPAYRVRLVDEAAGLVSRIRRKRDRRKTRRR
jgi:hypothetical protein